MTLHIVDVRLTCLINITYLLTYLDEERETTDATAYDPAEEMVRMTGAVGNSLELVSHQVSMVACRKLAST